MIASKKRQTGRGGAGRRPIAPDRAPGGARKASAVLRRAGGDLSALLALGLALAALLAYAALLPPTRLAFAADRPPPGVALHGFYGVERSAAGPFRWAKPEAALTLPATAPADYRITLALGDSPAAPPRRPVAVYVNGALLGTVTLDDMIREYTFRYRLSPRDWAPGTRDALQVAVHAPPFEPPGDQRLLGVMVARLAVEPGPPLLSGYAALVAPVLLLLIAAYASLRLAGLERRWTTVILGAALAACAVLAGGDRSLALFLSYYPAAYSHRLPLMLLGLAALPLLVRSGNRLPLSVPPPIAPGSTAAPTGTVAAGGVRLWSRRSLPLLSVLTLAGGLRLYRYDRLGLWLDEGATIHSSHLPWPVVLGLHGRYDAKPPLYYALVKLVATVVPDAAAGRLVSVVAGTATVVVLYALVARLADRRAALVAGAVLALSPLHIWYSQEARMYAPVVLLVGLSYLALVAFWQLPRWPRAVLYGIALVLAAYTDYSALYALAPQAVLLAPILKTHGRRASVLLASAAGAAFAFLPWLPQVAATVEEVGQVRAGFLGVTPRGVVTSLLSVMGVKNGDAYFWGGYATPWEIWPAWRGVLALVVAPAVVLGAIVLATRRPAAFLVALSLALGTIGTAIAVSVRSPGYAERTILPAVLGWAILIGAAACGDQPRKWLALLGKLSVIGVLLTSVVTLGAVYRGADKEHSRELVADAAVAATLGQPVIMTSPWTRAFVDAYAPHSTLQQRVYLAVSGRLDPALSGAGTADALWLAYANNWWDKVDDVKEQLAALGYQRLMRKYYRQDLYLELYARPGAQLGAAVPIDGGFMTDDAPATSAAAGWRLPAAGAHVPPAGTTDGGNGVGPGRGLVLTNQSAGTSTAYFDLGAAAHSLSTLEYVARAAPTSERIGATLTCLAGTRTVLYTAPEETLGPAINAPPVPPLAPIPNDGAWHSARIAVLCPADTVALQVALYNRGVGQGSFRDLRLWVATPAYQTAGTNAELAR